MEQHTNYVVRSNMCSCNENGFDISVVLSREKDEQLDIERIW